MNKERAEMLFKKAINDHARVLKEVEELKKKLDKADAKLQAKITKLHESGLIPSGGFISTGVDDDINSYMEYQDDLYDVHVKNEKAEYQEIRGQFLDKLIELDRLGKEIVIAEACYNKFLNNESQPGGSDE